MVTAVSNDLFKLENASAEKRVFVLANSDLLFCVKNLFFSLAPRFASTLSILEQAVLLSRKHSAHRNEPLDSNLADVNDEETDFEFLSPHLSGGGLIGRVEILFILHERLKLQQMRLTKFGPLVFAIFGHFHNEVLVQV